MSVFPPKPEFDHCAEDYARYRPTYPVEALNVLGDETGPPAGRLTADVGAGPGIFSQQLADAGWRVVAVEPSVAMLRCVGNATGCEGVDPTHRDKPACVIPLCAQAESTALRDRSVAMVTAAQAFHWFNPPYALAEFGRILQPDGVLALIWNNRDYERSPFVGAFEALVTRYNPSYRREYRQQDWPGKIAASGLFTAARHHRFEHDWTLSFENYIGFTRSVSYIRNTLSREQRPRFEDDLNKLMRSHFVSGNCVIPLRTDLWTARKK